MPPLRHPAPRQGRPDRNLESIYRRHLLPFLIELDASLPADERGVGRARLRHLERLPGILAGDEQLPAATVAGDQLGRRGIACIFLYLADAAASSREAAVRWRSRCAEGTVPLHTDVRTGADVVRSADLRTAGLLIERTTPHGVAQHRRQCAARPEERHRPGTRPRRRHRGEFNLVATEPLTGARMRAPRVPLELRGAPRHRRHHSAPAAGRTGRALDRATHRRPDLGELRPPGQRLRTRRCRTGMADDLTSRAAAPATGATPSPASSSGRTRRTTPRPPPACGPSRFLPSSQTSSTS